MATKFKNGIDASSQRIQGVGTPTAGTDAVNRNYVDAKLGGYTNLSLISNNGGSASNPLTSNDYFVEVNNINSSITVATYSSGVITYKAGVTDPNSNPLISSGQKIITYGFTGAFSTNKSYLYNSPVPSGGTITPSTLASANNSSGDNVYTVSDSTRTGITSSGTPVINAKIVSIIDTVYLPKCSDVPAGKIYKIRNNQFLGSSLGKATYTPTGGPSYYYTATSSQRSMSIVALPPSGSTNITIVLTATAGITYELINTGSNWRLISSSGNTGNTGTV